MKPHCAPKPLGSACRVIASAGEWRGLEVAIKTIVFESGPQSNQTARIASEAAIASNLVHHNVVATYSHSVQSVAAPTRGQELEVFKFYLIQEYCNGRSLRHALQQGLLTGPGLEGRWSTIMGLLVGIARGMSYIHSKRICHGDLNPANVLLKVCSHLPCHAD